MSEIWKPIPGYKGTYEVSNLGRVKSHIPWNGTQERILSQGLLKSGYYMVTLSMNTFYKRFRVHRLVWEAFNGPIPEGYEVNHKDECKTNNKLNNLELLTHKQNVNYGTSTARRIESLKRNRRVKET